MQELLANFTARDLGDALARANQPTSGAKADLVARLASLQVPPPQLLEFFGAEALRDVCSILSVSSSSGRKADMIRAVVSLLAAGSPGLGARPAEVVAGIAAPMAQAIAASPTRFKTAPMPMAVKPGPPVAPPQWQVPTMQSVYGHMQKLRISRRNVRDERDAHIAIGEHLAEVFETVFDEYPLGGYFASRIDIDIDNGKFGIEVKLAEKLLDSTSEIHRVIGQTVCYQRKRYGANLLVALVGEQRDLDEPTLKEAFSFLRDIGIGAVAVPLV
jgi:hypothetical protein